MINILIGGDVYPAGSARRLFQEGDASGVFNDLAKEFETADFSIINLECPLITKESAIVKTGPVLSAPTDCIRGLVAAHLSAVNLANNHSYDHGARGLEETMAAATRAGIEFVGAGLNLEKARRPLVRNIKNRRIVIFAMAEREFSLADHDSPGANPLDLINAVHAIRSYKQDGIFIILIHGGVEHYPYPSPELIRRCRFMVEMGADAVICTHAHRPLPWEYHAERPIVYGLGNLVFEAPPGQPPSWHEGYLAKLTIDEAALSFEPIPYIQSKDRPGVRRMDQEYRRRFLDEMLLKSAQVKNDEFIRTQWVDYCRRQTDPYLMSLLGYNKVLRRMGRLPLRLLHSRRDILRALHLVQCEAHHEILTAIFKDKRDGP